MKPFFEISEALAARERNGAVPRFNRPGDIREEVMNLAEGEAFHVTIIHFAEVRQLMKGKFSICKDNPGAGDGAPQVAAVDNINVATGQAVADTLDLPDPGGAHVRISAAIKFKSSVHTRLPVSYQYQSAQYFS
jgi:hypothetical protein